MKYFACIDDAGILVRASESASSLPSPAEWREVPRIYDHLSQQGVDHLESGEDVTFTQADQSYRQLIQFFN